MANTEESPVYNHFELRTVVRENQAVQCMQCKLCHEDLAAGKKASNLERHLKTRHSGTQEWLAFQHEKAEWKKRTGRDQRKELAKKFPLTDEQRLDTYLLKNSCFHVNFYIQPMLGQNPRRNARSR